MRRLLRLLRVVDLVWTEDYDEERRLRIVWYDKNGNRYVYGIPGPMAGGHPNKLLSDGGIACYPANSYLRRWHPFESGNGKTIPLSMEKEEVRYGESWRGGREASQSR